MALFNFPYRRDFRPASPESLGEHVDREFSKIETTIASIYIDWASLEDAANDTAAATAGVEIGKPYRNGSVLMVRVT